MRIESALYSAFTGIGAHGQAIAVISDNISNANTVGYKSARSEFSDLLGSQSSLEGQTVGSGVAISRVRQIHNVGIIEDTGRSLDVGIAGNGFFVVGEGEDEYYTRAGNFQMDVDGTLTTADGTPVLGYAGAEGETLSELNLLDVNLAGKATSAMNAFGNLDSTDEVRTIPANPDTFIALETAASFTNPAAVYDSLGVTHAVTLAFTKTGVNTWVAQAYMDGGEIGGTAGQPVQIGANATLTFQPTGAIAEADQAGAIITAAPAYSDGGGTGNFTIDLSSFTQFGAASQLAGLNQDGRARGEIKDYEFSADGRLSAVLDSGTTALIGRIPLAMFTNVDGLERVGNSMFAEGSTAGERELTIAGEGAAGPLQGDALERSTVDIGIQFIELVLYQRGYQANSQTLNATNGLIRDTLGLVR